MLCKMFKICCTLLLLVISSQLSLSFANLILNDKNGTDDMDILFNECKLDLNNIMVMDTSNTSTLFSNFHLEVGQQFFTEYSADKRKKMLDTTEIQGFIGIIDTSAGWLAIHRFLRYDWYRTKNCTTILISKPTSSCSGFTEILKYLLNVNFLKSYYICIQNLINPIVYTSTGYLNNNPQQQHWRFFGSEEIFNHTFRLFYRRFFDENICQGFDFDRVSSLNELQVTVSIFLNEEGNSRKIIVDDGEIAKQDADMLSYYYRGNALGKLLNISFRYLYSYTIPKNQDDRSLGVILNRSPANVVMNPTLVQDNSDYGDISYPISFEHFVILSRHQGFATPLEKIATFYGFWTLLSLIILLILTFIVIWWKKNRNIGFAAFDVIRLLINSGVHVPLNILSTRIFFSMIFLYFLIIHALFSGHIAEFLTVPTWRKNIDSIEDLKMPRIKTIYNLGNIYGNVDDAELLQKKTVQVGAISKGIEMVIDYPDVACFGPLKPYYQVINKMKIDKKLYMSKNQFSPTVVAWMYKKRFPLRERFDWALMTLTETNFFNPELELNPKIIASQTIKDTGSQVNFRPICLEDLKFAFIFLTFGNSLACICFFIELLISLKCNLYNS